MAIRMIGISSIAVLAVCLLVQADSILTSPLQTVKTSLERGLPKLEPKIEFSLNEEQTSLTASYLTQSFKIHGVGKSGVIAKEAHDETGPTHVGFVLTVHVQPKGEVNQAVTPQTVRRPYWSTDLDVTPLKTSDKQLYWALSYGSRTDKKLVESIRKQLKELGE